MPNINTPSPSNRRPRLTRRQPTAMPSTTSNMPVDENIGVVVPIVPVATTAAADAAAQRRAQLLELMGATATAEPAPEPEATPAPEPEATPALEPEAEPEVAPAPAATPEAATATAIVAQPGRGRAPIARRPAATESAVTAEALEEPVAMAGPTVSYKIPRLGGSHWHRYATPNPTGEPLPPLANGEPRPVGGALVDFHLTITRPENSDRKVDDHRLAMVFIQPDGSLAEINLNAANWSADTGAYCTAPGRSAISALWDAAASDDDMVAMTQGCRWILSPGRKAVFLRTEILVPGNDGSHSWLQVGRDCFNEAPREIERFIQFVEMTKAAYRSIGLLEPTPAVRGIDAGRGSAIPTSAAQVG